MLSVSNDGDSNATGMENLGQMSQLFAPEIMGGWAECTSRYFMPDLAPNL